MKIPKNPGPPSLPPENGKSVGASKTAGETGPPASSKHREAADKLTHAGSNTAANLMKAGGSAKEFATVGMKTLMQAAAGVGAAVTGTPSRTEQAWTNVAGAIFGPAAKIPQEMQTAVTDTAKHVMEGAFDKAAGATAGAVKNAPALDINQMIQFVIRESYMETTKDLQFYADKVKHFNDLKGEVRDRISTARKNMAETMAGKGDTGNKIKEWEEKLQSIGDDAQLANIDLQNRLQQQQQTLQTISNVSKMMHDTAMAVIRKIG